MAIFSVALVINFHLRQQSPKEEKLASLPLGIVFFVLSFVCLINGLIHYLRTADRYGRRAALVQSGWKFQIVVGVVAAAIIVTCCFLIAVNAIAEERESG